jgi:hypothetical protein
MFAQAKSFAVNLQLLFNLWFLKTTIQCNGVSTRSVR